MAKKTIKTAPQKTGAKKPASWLLMRRQDMCEPKLHHYCRHRHLRSGITGWLYKNIFASMSDFGSIGGAIKSILIAFLTVVLLYFLITQTIGLLDFAIFSAVWSDPQGLKREVAGLLNRAVPCQLAGMLPAGLIFRPRPNSSFTVPIRTKNYGVLI